jgi:hypothetical protein
MSNNAADRDRNTQPGSGTAKAGRRSGAPADRAATGRETDRETDTRRTRRCTDTAPPLPEPNRNCLPPQPRRNCTARTLAANRGKPRRGPGHQPRRPNRNHRDQLDRTLPRSPRPHFRRM